MHFPGKHPSPLELCLMRHLFLQGRGLCLFKKKMVCTSPILSTFVCHQLCGLFLTWESKVFLLYEWVWNSIFNYVTNTTVIWSQWNYGPIVLVTKLHERVTRIRKASSHRYLHSFLFVPANVCNFLCQTIMHWMQQHFSLTQSPL